MQDLATQNSPLEYDIPPKDAEYDNVPWKHTPSSNSERNSPILVDAEKGTGLEIIYVDFEPGDTHNPANWSHRHKWIVTFVASYFTALTGEICTTLC